jgi:hypothetical protein
MTENDVFKYLSENLRVSLNDAFDPGYGYGSAAVVVNLILKNPATGKDEIISSDSISIDMER